MAPEIFNYNTIGRLDEIFPVMMGNIQVDVSIPDLRHILILNSYYEQYQSKVKGMVDLAEFFKQMNETHTFDGYPDDYVVHIYKKFIELIPVLQQIKQYN
jgi:hypothetical protein